LADNMSAWPHSASEKAAMEPESTPLLGNLWWVPSAFAILALILLLAVPALVDKRLGKVRGELVLTSESARVLVNDLEAAFASQLLVRNVALPPSQTPAFARREKLDADNAALRVAVNELGPPAVAQYNDLSDRLNSWDASARD